ncbi:hypothetical protein, partial [Dickeya solani]|uniref:hypothetical protein n=1 Tax=Dickeya solani TaxID=1089444 RepID=UPI0005523A91
TLSAAAISQAESGSIQGGGPLRLLATGNIVNRGFVGTAGDLLVQAGGLIENGGLLYGGGDLQLLSAALVNRFGNILAGDSLWIQRDAAGNASSSVLNSSGTIETQRGDITVRTGTLTNQREGLTVTESSSTAAEVPSWAGGTTIYIPIDWFKDGELATYEANSNPSREDGPNLDEIYFFPFPVSKEKSTAIFSYASKDIKITANGGGANILSSGNINIASALLINDASVISSKKIFL